jgi:hypothetical protein
MALATDGSWASAARRLGLNKTTPWNWIQAHLAEEVRSADPLALLFDAKPETVDVADLYSFLLMRGVTPNMVQVSKHRFDPTWEEEGARMKAGSTKRPAEEGTNDRGARSCLRCSVSTGTWLRVPVAIPSRT